MTIENKIVAITGAGRGIGRATAIQPRAGRTSCSGRGDRRSGRRDRSGRRKASCRATDVTRRTDLNTLVNLACERFGRLDVIVNNAGIKAMIRKHKEELAISPAAIARAIAFAIEQPGDVEIGSIVVRPAAQD